MNDGQSAQLATAPNMINIIVIIIYLVLIVIAAYLLTRYVAKRSLKKGMKKDPSAGNRPGRKMKTEFGHLVSVADRIAVDRDKTVMVVEFQGKYYLLSTTPQGIKCIDKVPVPQQPAEESEGARTEAEVEIVAASSHAMGQPDQDGQESFFERFKKSFRVVFANYFKKSPPPEKSSEFSKQLTESIKSYEAEKQTPPEKQEQEMKHEAVTPPEKAKSGKKKDKDPKKNR